LSTSLTLSMLLTRQGGSFLDNHGNNQPGHGGLGGTRERGAYITCNQLYPWEGRGHAAIKGHQFWWPQRHNSDHQAVVATIQAGKQGKRRLKAYRQKRQEFLLQLPPQELWDDLTTAFVALQATCKDPEAAKRHWYNWVSDKTWLLIKRRTSLHQAGRLHLHQPAHATHHIRVTEGGPYSAYGTGW
jgi:hypothetical protein